MQLTQLLISLLVILMLARTNIFLFFLPKRSTTFSVKVKDTLIVVLFICRHCVMLQPDVHSSWKLITSHLFHGPLSHETCHPLRMFGTLSVQHYTPLPVSIQSFHPTTEDKRFTRFNKMIKSVLHCMRQMVVRLDTGLFPHPWPSCQEMHICSTVHSSLSISASSSSLIIKLHILKWPYIAKNHKTNY